MGKLRGKFIKESDIDGCSWKLSRSRLWRLMFDLGDGWRVVFSMETRDEIILMR